MKSRSILILAGIFGALSVALGAFGAHALQDILSADRLETWNTAVTYQMWHVLAILSLVLISKVFELELKWPINLMILGILIFSGSLYLLCLTDINWLGAITPIGGVCFILGWLLVGWNIFKSNEENF